MSILTPPHDVLSDHAHGINQAHPSGRPHDTAAASLLLASNAAIFFAASSHQYSTIRRSAEPIGPKLHLLAQDFQQLGHGGQPHASTCVVIATK
jgi:hypothetical protein